MTIFIHFASVTHTARNFLKRDLWVVPVKTPADLVFVIHQVKMSWVSKFIGVAALVTAARVCLALLVGESLVAPVWLIWVPVTASVRYFEDLAGSRGSSDAGDRASSGAELPASATLAFWAPRVERRLWRQVLGVESSCEIIYGPVVVWNMGSLSHAASSFGRVKVSRGTSTELTIEHWRATGTFRASWSSWRAALS